MNFLVNKEAAIVFQSIFQGSNAGQRGKASNVMVKDGRSQPPPVPIGRWPILHGDPYNHGSTEGGEYAVPPLLLGMLGIYFQMPPFGWAFPEGMKQLRKVLCSILSYLRSSNSVQNRKNIGTKVFWC